jgi:hypothetical protein
MFRFKIFEQDAGSRVCGHPTLPEHVRTLLKSFDPMTENHSVLVAAKAAAVAAAPCMVRIP